MNTLEQNASKKYTPWLILTLLDFVTIISFENIFYPFQNQGLSVVISWIFMLFAYVIPYELIVSQLGLTFAGWRLGSGAGPAAICSVMQRLGCTGFRRFRTSSTCQTRSSCRSVGLSSGIRLLESTCRRLRSAC